jgi:uncharacterized membrane protein
VSVHDLTSAIVSGINAGGEQFLEGTLAAVLPILWLAIIGLHLGRPYILDMIDRFTLRLGADLLWLLYIAIRDILIISGVVMSFMFFFPDVVLADALPITGGFAAASLFGVLLVKLMGDPDNNLRDFRLTTTLLGLGALFYFIPYVLGVQGSFSFSPLLVTSTNASLAVILAYISVGLLAVMGAVAAGYVLKTGGRAEIVETAANEQKNA